ncbi:MAG: hypothetical protein Kow0022_06940 [Phycisphaerales bacterium]
MSEARDEQRTTQARTTASLSAEATFRAMPARIGKYVVGERIGTGGMGVVYRAQHSETGATVAIKLIRAEVSSEQTIARLKQEARALGALKHPGIAAVHDAGMEVIDGVETPYIAMEYLPGAKPITAYAASFSEREKLELFIEVCRAIDHANTRGVIHRDLKPSNILVDAEGAAKVIDFGVAKILHAAGAQSRITEHGHLIGTFEYMAPEQVQGRSELIDARTDVHGLGVVLFELLCGCLPYKVSRRSPAEAIRVLCDDPPTRPTQARRGFSNELETILLKMLAKERSRRYQTAAEAADDIERYLQGRPIQARRDTALYRLRKALVRGKERHTRETAAAIMVLSIIMTIVFGTRLMYEWTGLARAYVAWLTGLRPIAAPLAPEHVVVIGVKEPSKLARFAGEFGPIDERDPTSWRFAYGMLLERLSECRPRSVGLDFRFASCRQAEQLVRGMEALQRQGIGTVIGTGGFVRLGERPTDICPSIVDAAASWGAVTVGRGAPGSYAVRLGLVRKQTRARCASFGVALFAVTRRPDAAAFDLDIAEDGVHINYVDPPTGAPPGKANPQHDRLILTEEGQAAEDLQRNTLEGDRIASAAVSLGAWALDEGPPTTQMLSDVLDEQIFPIDRLRAWVRDKAVLVIDLRPGWDSDQLPDGRTLHHGYLWAAWLEQALRDAHDADVNGRWAGATVIRGARSGDVFLHVVAGAAIGSLLLMWSVRAVWKLCVLLAVSAAFVAASVVLMMVGNTLLVPLLGLVALWTSGMACILFPSSIQA